MSQRRPTLADINAVEWHRMFGNSILAQEVELRAQDMQRFQNLSTFESACEMIERSLGQAMEESMDVGEWWDRWGLDLVRGRDSRSLSGTDQEAGGVTGDSLCEPDSSRDPSLAKLHGPVPREYGSAGGRGRW